MDAHWFLSQRVSFIRQLYLHATAPFVELQRVIETCETPLAPPTAKTVPPYLLSNSVLSHLPRESGVRPNNSSTPMPLLGAARLN